MSHHEARLVSEIRKLAASFLGRTAGPRSLLTVTDCLLSKNGQNITILLSVLPESEERAALAFAERQTSELVRYIRTHLRVGHIPQIYFALDDGEKHRQKIDKLVGK